MFDGRSGAGNFLREASSVLFVTRLRNAVTLYCSSQLFSEIVHSSHGGVLVVINSQSLVFCYFRRVLRLRDYPVYFHSHLVAVKQLLVGD